MKISYKILSVNQNDASIVVRYFTDFLSEQELAGRTDYNLTLWNLNMSENELHDYILTNAPMDWLQLKESVINKKINTQLLSNIQKSIGVIKSGIITPPKAANIEIDITNLLSET